MTRRILTRETFDRQPGVGEVQSHDPRLRFAAIFNTLSPIVGVSSAKPLVLGGGSVLQPGHYGMGVFNPSNANIGAGSSSSDVRFNSTLSDLAVVLAVNWLHGGYTERSMTLLNLSGGNYIPSITMNSYYSTIDGRFAEGYSGTTLSGSFAKSVPGVVVFRRIGTALTLECRSATGAYGRYTATDTKRSVPELGAGGVGIGGGNAVAAAYIIEGSVGDDEALALLSNPWRVFKGRRLFVGGWASGGGGSVSSDLSDSSGILNSVSSDLADSASILSLVSSDLGDSVAILNSTSADLGDSALIFTSASCDLADSYDIQASSTVTSDLSDSAPIFNTVSSDLADSSEIRVAVASDLADSAGIFSAVLSDLTDSVTTFNTVASDLTDSVTVYSAVSSDLIDSAAIWAGTGGGGASADEIVAAIWAQAATTPLPVDVRRMNSATVYGDGTPANKWRGYV